MYIQITMLRILSTFDKDFDNFYYTSYITLTPSDLPAWIIIIKSWVLSFVYSIACVFVLNQDLRNDPATREYDIKRMFSMKPFIESFYQLDIYSFILMYYPSIVDYF